jgi:hypothetical protein
MGGTDDGADLGNMTQRNGVMVRGRWIPETEIQARPERIAASTR